MASNGTNGNGSQLLVVGNAGGVTLIDPSTPLRRLNYFDGKFLRASDFDIEQGYLRQLVAISNQGMGPGVVYGYDTVLGNGDTIQIGPGLAIDPSGKVLLMQGTATQSIQALIDASNQIAASKPDSTGKTGPGVFTDCIAVAAPPPVTTVAVSDIYVIAICAAEALCGQEDVYGKLCEEACVTSTDRPYRLDGVVLRAIPLQLVTPLPTSKAVAIDSNLYMRSKVAHSWFADEVLRHPNAISRAGLLSKVWCLGAGYDSSCCEVPLAVVARAGSTTIFLDAWTVRRERMEAPSRRYWERKMMMRPWDVFIAQILQFQCQLADLLSGVTVPGSRGGNTCGDEHQALGEAASLMDEVRAGLANYRSAITNVSSSQPPLMALSLTRIADLRERIATVLKAAGTPSQPTDRILINGGIIELSSAGYLPVMNRSTVSVNDQVRALLGEGLDLRFCIASADYIAHEVEKAQHMDRISLLQGLDDPSNKPKVDIIVPDGVVGSQTTTPVASLYDTNLTFSAQQTGASNYKGAGREVKLATGGTALFAAGSGLSQSTTTHLAAMATSLGKRTLTPEKIEITPNLAGNSFIGQMPPGAADFTARMASFSANSRVAARDGFWIAGRTVKAIKDLAVGQQSAVATRILLGTNPTSPTAVELTVNGTLSIASVAPTGANTRNIKATLDAMLTVGAFVAHPANEEEFEILFTEHVNMMIAFDYNGDDQSGAIAMTITPSANSPFSLTITKTYSGNVHVSYAVTMMAATGAAPADLAKLDLVRDPDVVNPANTNHQLADQGLDIIQAAVLETEPSFKQRAVADLFPALPASTTEFVIEAVRDWVMFTKRREEQCALAVPAAPPPPPRSYLVLDFRAKGAADAKELITAFTTAMQDPAALEKLLAALIVRATRDKVRLIVKFQGGSAIAISNLTTAAQDWSTSMTPKPGNVIVFAAAGAAGEDDSSLQTRRIQTFENSINAFSKESPSIQEVAILPYPTSAVPPDADGIMLFVTVADTETQHVFATTNIDAYHELEIQARQGQITTATIGRLTDLGTASASGSGASQTVTDTEVLTAFNRSFAGDQVTQSMMISRQGDSGDELTNRLAMATQVVKDITATAPAPVSITYQPAFPISDAPSMLIMLATQSTRGTRTTTRTRNR